MDCPAGRPDRRWCGRTAVLPTLSSLGVSEPARFARILVGLLAGRDRSLAALLVRVLRPVRRLHFGRGAGRRRQIELGRHHQRRALAVLDALVLHVGAADAGHDVFDDLFLEGLVVLLLVVAGACRAGGHHQADAEGNARRAACARVSEEFLHNPAGWLRCRASRCSCSRFREARPARAVPRVQARTATGPYRPGSGRFCGGYPQEGVIQ